MRQLPVVVTGGVATGKSTVLERFRWNGLTVASADAVVADIWADPQQARPITAELGVGFPVDKDILRAKLADPDFRALAANRLHPRVMERLFALDAQVTEIPLLFEACLQGLARTIVVVTCSPETQLRRLAARLGDEDKARALIATQLPGEVKAAFADWLVDSENGIDSMNRHVDHIVRWMADGLAEATRS